MAEGSCSKLALAGGAPQAGATRRAVKEGNPNDSGADRPGGRFDRRAEASRADFVGELFARLRAPLERHLHGLLQQHADVDDVLQETYARLLKIERLDRSTARVHAFVFRIATNLALDRHRRRKTRGIEQDIDTVPLDSVAPSPEHIVAADQGLAVVRQVLLELPPRCRRVFLLRAVEQLSYADIAARLGIGKRTAEREMQRALEVLQRRLKG